MRLVLQRVSRAAVRIGGEPVAEIRQGLLVLVAVGHAERQEDVAWLAGKVCRLRVFEDSEGRMNLDLLEAGGEVLLVPQFTLYGETRRGRRPSWTKAAPPAEAERWVDAFAAALEECGAVVHRGVFREHMEVELVNDGPVTLFLEAASKPASRSQDVTH